MPPTAIPYAIPTRWIHYDATAIVQNFVDAKAAVLSLRATPHQRDWVEKRQKLQLKMEVAGTSRIEGADFTERELDAALDIGKKAEDLATRSQRQARAAAETYRWIATIPYDHPITEDLVLDIHRRLVIDCDDDHCPPGRLRVQDKNVTFGFPRHRGCAGGPPGTILIENPPICPICPSHFVAERNVLAVRIAKPGRPPRPSPARPPATRTVVVPYRLPAPSPTTKFGNRTCPGTGSARSTICQGRPAARTVVVPYRLPAPSPTTPA